MAYEVVAPGRGALVLHPSRVVRFLGNAWPDPSLMPTCWSDSVLQVLYDAIHAVALTTAGATSLMHEAKVDVVTVPNLSEHLSSTDTTAQLSARFAYAAAMKSINNLLLLGDGESWARQKIDFAGLPEMVRTFLQVAAGAADIPVTRLLGQSPSGLSATGDSDTRNYYDMIAARQELDLRPQLERLDRLILRSEGLDSSALSFAFRPLWQLDAPAKAALALSKAQATQVYAGLGLWPAAMTARLVEAQLVQDGTYPNAQAVFAEAGAKPFVERSPDPIADYVGQPRNKLGQFAEGGQSAAPLVSPASEISREEQFRRRGTGGPPPAVETPYSPRFRIDPRAFPWVGSGQGGSEAPSTAPEVGQQSHIKPPQDAYDPDGPKAPGKPPPEKGFRDPKSGENWVRNPNGRGYGWEDDKGDVWIPTGRGGSAHGGPHWDVQGPGGRYRNERPLRKQN